MKVNSLLASPHGFVFGDHTLNIRKEYRCKCANRLFRVLVEPIRRKERTRESADLRVGIECPLCGAEARIKLGGPN